MSLSSWIGFDLDGTLAEYNSWGDGSIGKPIESMLAVLKNYLSKGVTCKIVTARVSGRTTEESVEQRELVKQWLVEHIGSDHNVSVTSSKDFAMLLLYDDRCVAVEKNTGKRLNYHEVEQAYDIPGVIG